MLTVRVYHDYTLIALKGLNTNDFEGSECSTKLQSNYCSADTGMEELRHASDTKLIQTTRKSSYSDFTRRYKGKVPVTGFSGSLDDFSV